MESDKERIRIIYQLHVLDKAANRSHVNSYHSMSTELLTEKLNRLIDENMQENPEEEVNADLQKRLNLYKFLLSYMTPSGFMQNLSRERYDMIWSKLNEAYPEVMAIVDPEQAWKLVRDVIDKGVSQGWDQFMPMMRERNNLLDILNGLDHAEPSSRSQSMDGLECDLGALLGNSNIQSLLGQFNF